MESYEKHHVLRWQKHNIINAKSSCSMSYFDEHEIDPMLRRLRISDVEDRRDGLEIFAEN